MAGENKKLGFFDNWIDLSIEQPYRSREIEDGFLTELFEMLSRDAAASATVEEKKAEITDFIAKNIPDPKQLAIPSEPFDRRDFTDKLGKRRRLSGWDRLMSDHKMDDIGADLVLKNLLNQLDSIPAKQHEYDSGGTFQLPARDIEKFFLGLGRDNARSYVQKDDLPNKEFGRTQDIFDQLLGLDI